jgi:hydrophobic/amphiphilic exporter-1 (mainly G- bacteria), HAE1 family
MEVKKDYKPQGFAKWTRFFIDKYRISILIIVAIVVAGALGVIDIPKQDFPDIPANMVLVRGIYPGASSADVEQDVLIPLENEITEIQNIKTIRSNAGNSFGTIFIEFDDFKDLDKRVTEISDLIKEIALPAEAEVNVEPINVTGPTVAYALTGDNYTQEQLLEMAPATASYLQTSSPEIKEVMILPEAKLRVEIELDSEKMSRLQLTKEMVAESVKAATTTLPGGFITVADEVQKPITVNSTVREIGDIEDIRIGNLKLSDIATVKRVPAQTDVHSIVGYIDEDGRAQSTEAIYLMAFKKGDGDVLRVSDSAAAAVVDIHNQKIIPEDVSLVKAYDTSPYVRSLINDLAENGVLGLIIILIVLLLFVNLRAGLVVAMIIPLAFLVTWFVLPLLGYTLNILTLFAMILSLGILVDNAIVIAEGMMANLERGYKKRAAAFKAVKDFGPAIASATVTTIIVLIPYALMGGIMGEFLKYIPITLIVMLLASYFLAVSIVPLFGKWFFSETTAAEKKQRRLRRWQKLLILPVLVYYAQRSIDCIVGRYRGLMKTIISRKRWLVLVVVLTVVMMVVSFGYFLPQLQFSQFPESDGEQLAVTVTYPAGTSFSEQRELYKNIGVAIITIPHFQSFFFYEGMFMVFVTEPTDRNDDLTIKDIAADLNDKLEAYRTEKIVINAAPQSYGPPAQDFDVIVELKVNDREVLAEAITDLEDFVLEKENIDRVVNGPRDLLVPAVEIDFDESKLVQVGGSPLMTSVIINSIFTETEAGNAVIRDDGSSDKVVVLYDEEIKNSVSDLEDLFIASPTGGRPFRLAEVASIKEVEQPNSIARLAGERVGALRVKMTEAGDAAALEKEIKEYLNTEKLETFGLQEDDLVFGGEFASVMETSSNLQIVFIIAVLLVFIVLVYQFNSWGQPFFILLTVPLAMIGVFPGLFLTGSSLDMVSGLGVIALVGIVVNDAIVFIDYLNRVRRENPTMPLGQALVETGGARFKPIFTTSITTIGGILPLAINDPFWMGLGTSVVSGLIFSTIGTLIVIPVVIYLFSRKPNKGKPWLEVSPDQDLTNGCGYK